VWVFDGDILKTYKNGVKVGSLTDSHGAHTYSLSRANRLVSVGRSTIGTIGYLKMYNGVALDQSDVTTLFSPHRSATGTAHDYDFRGCSSDTIIPDSANHLSLRKSAFVTCSAEGASFPHGVDSYMQFDDFWYFGAHSLTFEFMFRTAAAINSESRLFQFGDADTPTDTGFLMKLGEDGLATFSMLGGNFPSSGGNMDSIYSTYPTESYIETETWIHLVLVLELDFASQQGATATWYKNGVNVGDQTNLIDGVQQSNSPFLFPLPRVCERQTNGIGANLFPPSGSDLRRHFVGTIAQFTLYNGIALTGEEIFRRYNETALPMAPSHEWDFRSCTPVAYDTGSRPSGSDILYAIYRGDASCVDHEGLTLDGSSDADFAKVHTQTIESSTVSWAWGGAGGHSFEVLVRFDAFKIDSDIFSFGRLGESTSQVYLRIKGTDLAPRLDFHVEMPEGGKTATLNAEDLADEVTVGDWVHIMCVVNRCVTDKAMNADGDE